MIGIPNRFLPPGLFWALGVMVVRGVVVEPVKAQTYTRPSERTERTDGNNRKPRESVGSLPSWAEPADHSSRSSQFAKQKSLGSPSTNADPPPQNPDPIPVDGGLLWLVMAGGGYASWKLGLAGDTS